MAKLQEEYFGYKLCSARNVIECAFGCLKSRFSALRREINIKLHDLPTVIYACFMLHNFCKINKEFVCEDRVRLVMEEQQRPQPTTHRTAVQSNENKGKLARRVLTMYLDP